MRQHINPDDINMSELLAIVGQNNRRQLEHALEELCRPVVQLFLKKHHIPPVHQPTIISQAKKDTKRGCTILQNNRSTSHKELHRI